MESSDHGCGSVHLVPEGVGAAPGDFAPSWHLPREMLGDACFCYFSPVLPVLCLHLKFSMFMWNQVKFKQ